MILYFATILLALDSSITIVSSQERDKACLEVAAALITNRGCYNALLSLIDSNVTEALLTNADLQAYCSSSCRSLITRVNQFCVSCT